ncbi:MAG: DUF2723 domain-containing protein [Anaerolineae bacterium]|nr:DUF2723 domain-containing protein [Anaerolineae bacterium]
MAPTVYELDSAEFATGAAIMGVVHAPGYPLYTFIAHVFTLLPIGDVAYRVNLLSALCLALTAPVVYSMLSLLIHDRRITASATLLLIWSYYVWGSGTAAEIYAPQILTLALVGWSLVRLYRSPQPGWRDALRTGLLFGLAVAMVQSSIFFAPGLALAFRLKRVSWRASLAAGVLCAAIIAIPLVYFPLRYQAHPDFNKIGYYDADGAFHSFDFTTPGGLLEAVSGKQFRPLFFAEGVLPTPARLATTFAWFWQNFLGIGLLVGWVGLFDLYQRHRRFLIAWLGLFVPYTYFYMCYGATDRDTMFGPSYLLWTIPVVYGLCRALQWQAMPLRARYAALAALPVLALVTNFASVDLSQRTDIRDHAQAVLDTLPPNAIVAGYWADVTPLQYLHFVEKQRPDVKIYDLFLFEPNAFHRYMDEASTAYNRPIVFVTNTALTYVIGTPYTVTPIWYTPSGRLPMITSFEAKRMAVSSR